MRPVRRRLAQVVEQITLNHLLPLVLIFLKVGVLTFGGAAGIFPALAHELVKGGWLTREEFLYGLALSQGTPGPAVIGMAIAGIKWAGWVGGVAVLAALILPGLLWMALLMHFQRRFQHLLWTQWFLAGIRPAVPGLLAAMAWKLQPRGIPLGMVLLSVGLTLWLIFRWRMPPVLLLIGAIAIGCLAP